MRYFRKITDELINDTSKYVEYPFRCVRGGATAKPYIAVYTGNGIPDQHGILDNPDIASKGVMIPRVIPKGYRSISEFEGRTYTVRSTPEFIDNFLTFTPFAKEDITTLQVIVGMAMANGSPYTYPNGIVAFAATLTGDFTSQEPMEASAVMPLYPDYTGDAIPASVIALYLIVVNKNNEPYNASFGYPANDISSESYVITENDKVIKGGISQDTEIVVTELHKVVGEIRVGMKMTIKGDSMLIEPFAKRI